MPKWVPVQPHLNVAGVIALVMALSGFLLAWYPGALMLAWIPLAASLLLGIVGLLTRGTRWPAVTALLVAVTGAAVFAFTTLRAVDDSLSSDVAVTSAGGTALPGDTGTSPDNPLPIGSTVSSHDWSVTLNSVAVDATEEVVTADTLNNQPAEGQAYALATITITYTGVNPQGGMHMESVFFVLPDGTSVPPLDESTATPNPIHAVPVLEMGTSTTGNLAFRVPAAIAAKGTISIQPAPSSAGRFFALR